MLQLAETSDTTARSSSATTDLTRTRYVVEQCTSQQDDTYEQVWRGSAGEAGERAASEAKCIVLLPSAAEIPPTQFKVFPHYH